MKSEEINWCVRAAQKRITARWYEKRVSEREYIFTYAIWETRSISDWWVIILKNELFYYFAGPLRVIFLPGGPKGEPPVCRNKETLAQFYQRARSQRERCALALISHNKMTDKKDGAFLQLCACVWMKRVVAIINYYFSLLSPGRHSLSRSIFTFSLFFVHRAPVDFSCVLGDASLKV